MLGRSIWAWKHWKENMNPEDSDPADQTRPAEIVKLSMDYLSKDHWQVNGPLPADAKQNRIWRVMIFTKSGSRPRRLHIHWFSTRAKAKSFMVENPVGSVFNVADHDEQNLGDLRDLHDMIDNEEDDISFFADSDDSSLILDVLEDAKVINSSGFTSQSVLDLLGEDRIQELKVRYPDSWSYAAEFEYCARTFSKDSLALVAAQCQYHREITGDAFLQGYLQRDLEILIDDVDGQAFRKRQSQKAGGKETGGKNSIKRMRRIESLLQAMEEWIKREGRPFQLQPLFLAHQALEEAKKKDPEVWSEGEGQIEAYVDDMKGPRFGLHERFCALFSHLIH
jgi:hypothetical protein